MIKLITREFSKSPFMVFLFLKFRYFFSMADDCLRKLTGKKPILYYMEYHVTDHCNLNCKACSHFCNLVESNVFASVDQYKRDIKRLTELFDNIRTITLLGGEPLLHKELPQIIYETRKAFPKSKIHLVTNGLLYKSMSEELISSIKNCDVLIRITLYKPMMKHQDELERRLSSLGIRFLISRPALRFGKNINLEGTSDAKKMISQCHRAKCTFLMDGYICRCGLPLLIKYFNRYFDQSIHMERSWISIHDKHIDGYLLKKMLLKPIDACRYCTKWEWFDWEVSGPEIKIEDFCVIED